MGECISGISFADISLAAVVAVDAQMSLGAALQLTTKSRANLGRRFRASASILRAGTPGPSARAE